MIGRTAGRRRATDRTMRVLMLLAVALALIPLGWIIYDVVKLGAHALGPHFFTRPPGDPNKRGGGAANGIIGTLMMVGLASAMAVPAGVLGAVYLVEFAPRSRFAKVVRVFGDVMTGIPSIVFGIFAYSVIVVAQGHFSGFAGAIAIALIMWPIIMRTAEEMLRLVPNELREASYALGVPKWRTILKVVLPSAAGGLLTGSMLGIARASGETAPLLFTALGNQFTHANLNRAMSALPLEIFRGATTAFAASIERAWASALTLIVLVLALSLGSRLIVERRRA